MLVLTRKLDEKVYIRIHEGTVVPKGGIEITVFVQEAEYGICRLGFGAPREVAILRDNARERTRK